jgi:hypothetical protein
MTTEGEHEAVWTVFTGYLLECLYASYPHLSSSSLETVSIDDAKTRFTHTQVVTFLEYHSNYLRNIPDELNHLDAMTLEKITNVLMNKKQWMGQAPPPQVPNKETMADDIQKRKFLMIFTYEMLISLLQEHGVSVSPSTTKLEAHSRALKYQTLAQIREYMTRYYEELKHKPVLCGVERGRLYKMSELLEKEMPPPPPYSGAAAEQGNSTSTSENTRKQHLLNLMTVEMIHLCLDRAKVPVPTPMGSRHTWIVFAMEHLTWSQLEAYGKSVFTDEQWGEQRIQFTAPREMRRMADICKCLGLVPKEFVVVRKSKEEREEKQVHVTEEEEKQVHAYATEEEEEVHVYATEEEEEAHAYVTEEEEEENDPPPPKKARVMVYFKKGQLVCIRHATGDLMFGVVQQTCTSSDSMVHVQFTRDNTLIPVPGSTSLYMYQPSWSFLQEHVKHVPITTVSPWHTEQKIIVSLV